MKKKFKKLSLNMETVRNLVEPSLSEVAGGVSTDSVCTRACSLCTIACSACCP